jgi:iron complex transport system ATP-binding protein
MLSLENISLGYRSGKSLMPVFVPFSAQAQTSQLVALIGRNGRGKSTLLRCIAGLQKVLSGNIFVHSKNINHVNINHIPHRHLASLISYVATDNVKVGYLKAFDLVALGRYPYLGVLGKLKHSDKIVVERSLQQVGMLAFAHRNVCQLSDGERQRIIIARALAQDTPVIILDEPTAFLDVPNRYEITSLLRNLAEHSGKTIVFSTHDLNIALRTAHQVWLMGNDKFYSATPQALLQQGILTTEFALPALPLDI